MFSNIKKMAIAFLLINSACARAETTVAITTTVHADATAEDKTLMQGLLPLMEVAVGEKEGLQVVEREAVAAMVAELARNRSLGAEQLQVGQMDGADLIVAVELSPPKKSSRDRFAVVRVTEAATAVVRGVTAVPVSAALIEEAAAEIADYVAAIAKGPKSQRATIAVLPFESVERFDRLRPLERGLRDLFTSALLRHEACRVVQRSSMEQLLMELDLVRAGLTDGARGLEGAPEREAAYVLRGEIDERTSPEGNLVVIVAELVDVASRKVVAQIERSCQRQDLADQVAEIAGEISQLLSAGDVERTPMEDAGIQEIDRLYELALRDVFRFIRHNPYDASYHIFAIPGVQRPKGLHARVEPDSPLGTHLLQKSIDRLESVLFVEPERLTAALPLAYCLSFHVEGVWRPQQCEQLLRQIFAETASDKMQEAATWWLGAMYFPHRGCLHSVEDIGKVDPELIRLGFDRQLEAFAYLPKGGRWAHRWLLLRILERICTHTGDEKQWSALMKTIDQTVGKPATRKLTPISQKQLLKNSSSLLAKLLQTESASGNLKTEAEAILNKWRHSNDRWCRLYGAKQWMRLNREDLSEQEYNALLDEIFADATDPYVQQCQTVEKTELAKRLRTQGDLEAALQILEGFEPKDHTRTLGHDYSYCNYGYQLARCYEGLGRKSEALEAYMNYAEMPYQYHYGLDFAERIDALGGVPLREDRDIDVRYLGPTRDKLFYCRVLATDGEQLFCGGSQNGRMGLNAIEYRSVWTRHLATGEWTNLGGPDDRVSCLAVADDHLWAGTDHKGLWRMSLANGDWHQWTIDDGLPTNTIVAVEAQGPVAYASIGNIDSLRRVISGGVVRVNPSAKSPNTQSMNGSIHTYRDKEAPQTAPGSMTIHANQLVVNGVNDQLRSLDLKTNQWQRLPVKSSPLVSSGSSGIWFAPSKQVASLLDVNGAIDKSYPAAPLLKDYPAGNYFPKFFVEHDDQLWIGGYPWRRFGDSGLFRLDLATGNLMRYGPRHGFRYLQENSYECYDGVWARGRLWVATSSGLAEISIHNSSEPYSKTPIEKFAETIKSVLPKGWAVFTTNNSITLRRYQKVRLVPLYGRPHIKAAETDSEYLHHLGARVTLDFDLRVIPRRSTDQYQKLLAKHAEILQRAKNGFKNKTELSEYFRLKEKHKLPVYFTPSYSIFVDGMPSTKTIRDDSARQEMKEIFAKLKTLLQLYEGASPLEGSRRSKKQTRIASGDANTDKQWNTRTGRFVDAGKPSASKQLPISPVPPLGPPKPQTEQEDFFPLVQYPGLGMLFEAGPGWHFLHVAGSPGASEDLGISTDQQVAIQLLFHATRARNLELEVKLREKNGQFSTPLWKIKWQEQWLKARKLACALLEEDQIRRVEQVLILRLGFHIFLDEDFQQSLQLSEEQVKKIKAGIRDHLQGRSRESLRNLVREIGQILTPQQRTKFDEMRGLPVNQLHTAKPQSKASGPVDQLDEKGFSQLHRARSVEVAQTLIDRGADVDVRQRKFHGTPLQYAASFGRLDVVRLLLKHKATVDAVDLAGRTPLMWAASKGHTDVARALIRSGADVNQVTNRQSTALHYAADRGHLEVAQLLIENGASLTLKNSQGKTPLDLNPEIAVTE